MHRSRTAVVLAALVVAATALPAAAASLGTHQQQAQSANGYAGTNVAFTTNASAVANYSVGGATVFDRVAVQSQSEAEAEAGLSAGLGLEGVTGVAGAAASLQTTSNTEASVTFESGARLQAHDNGHGSMVLVANENDQYVTANVTSDATLEAQSDDRVVIHNGNGSHSAVLVAGNGSVDVNAAGNLTADVRAESRLVVRTYGEERSSTAKTQERMIANGTATAQVYMGVEGEAEADVVTYESDTDVSVTTQTENTVNVTVDRAESEGRVVMASMADSTVESDGELDVLVDGEAAVQASSYSELRSAAHSGATSKYMLASQTEAEASADVLVAVNHFSERTVTMQSGEDSSTDGGDGDDSNQVDNDDDPTTGSGGPGFGVIVGVMALLGAAALAIYRR